MTATKEEMHQMLTETIDYYGQNPKERRSVSEDGQCVYDGPNGKRCGASRLMDEHDFEIVKKEQTTAVHIFPNLNLWGKWRVGFILQLQELHDADRYWDMTGITDIGKSKADEIRNAIDRGYYN